MLVRFALSKLALKMNSSPSASATALMAAHSCMQCSSLCITLGPAMRKNGLASHNDWYVIMMVVNVGVNDDDGCKSKEL